MNFLLFCDKRQKRDLETIVQKTENCNLIGTEVVIRNDFIERVFDEYNPHGVIISHGVRNESDYDEAVIAVKIKERRPSMRIVFFYGEITDKEDFQKYYDILTSSMIYDIITNQRFADIFPQVTKNPFSKSELDETLREKTPEEQLVVEQPKQNYNIVYDVAKKATINLNKEALVLHEFDMMNVENISEVEPEYINMDCVTIGVSGLQHHIGCTHTSFEIAQFLRKNNRKACVILFDDDCYKRLAEFYGVPSGSAGGMLLEKINVFHRQGLEQALQNYNYVILDCGILNDESLERYAACAVKIMLSSAADWDLSIATDYINSEAAINDIYYCFYPVSRKKFVNINRRMVKSGNHAYRLSCSEEFFLPCTENESVYQDILKRHSISMKKKNEAIRGKRKW